MIEPPLPYEFPLPPGPVCHGYTVGLSADISTASVFPTVLVFVITVYQILPANGEESLNVLGINYCRLLNYDKNRCLTAAVNYLSRIGIGDQKKYGNRQREYADQPGVQGLPGE